MGQDRWEPPSHAAAPRLGEPEREYSLTDARGVTRSIRADAAGFVWPSNASDVEVVDSHRLPVASEWTFPTDAPAKKGGRRKADDQTGDDSGSQED